MSREPAKRYADRLPPIVAREEKDISHLDDEMAELLYPGSRPRPFRVSILFEPFEGPDAERADRLARRADRWMAAGDARRLHRADFGVERPQALAARELFDVVGRRPGTDVLIDGRRVPYARELWLPLAWLFVGGD